MEHHHPCSPVSGWVKSLRLSFFGHLAHAASEEDHHRVIAAALRPPADWRRPVGHRRTTWLRTIDDDLPLDLLRGTVSQTSSTVLLTPIYLNAVSKLYSSREHIVTNFVSAPGRLCKQRYTNLFIIIIIIIIQSFNFGVDTAWRKARERDVWHQVISSATLHSGVRQKTRYGCNLRGAAAWCTSLVECRFNCLIEQVSL